MELLLSHLDLVDFQMFVSVLTAFVVDLSTSHDKAIYSVIGMFTVLSEQ